MGTITGTTIIGDAALALKDVPGTRWPGTDLLAYLNDGLRELVILKPEACTYNGTFQLTAGATRHTLPQTAIELIDITRNMGADGATPGLPITITSKRMLDAVEPTWSTTASDGYIKHYSYDVRDPKVFFTYRKAPATAWYVDIIYSLLPTPLSTAGDALTVDDIYKNALLEYVLHRAYSKDAETQNGQLAVAHYQAFANLLGVKIANEQGRNPNLTATPFNAAVPSTAKI